MMNEPLPPSLRAGSPGTPPADIDFRVYQKRLKEILTKHNPSMLPQVDILLKKFPGKEHQVYVQMCRKCSVKPGPPPTDEERRAFYAAEVAEESKESELTKWLVAHDF